MNQINNRLEEINDRVQDIDQRTERMNGHMTGMNTRITTINETLQIGNAQTANLRIVNRNARLQTPNVLEPLRKTVRYSDMSHYTLFIY